MKRVALVVLATAAAAQALAAPPGGLQVEQTVLPNGLHVIVAPDPSVSSVVVDVRYGFGAADEQPDQSGFAHAVERLMFAGTTHVADYDARIEGAHGYTSSLTAADHVSVFEEVPAGALELALWLEAERMAALPDSIDASKLAAVRASIAAERRSAFEDHPYALVDRAVQQALWGSDPNANPVIGDGLDHASVAAVTAFARGHVVPAAATLVIAGNVAPAHAVELARRYFAWMPRAAPPAGGERSVSPLARAVEQTVHDPLPKVVVAFRTAAPYRPGDPELAVAARILAGDRSSRLARTLVEGALATEVHADVIRQASGGELQITATVRDGVDPAQLAAAIRTECAQLRVSAGDVARARGVLEAELVTGLEGLVFRAESLAAWSAYTGTAGYLGSARAALRAVTPESVEHAAALWLRTAVTVIGVAGP